MQFSIGPKIRGIYISTAINSDGTGYSFSLFSPLPSRRIFSSFFIISRPFVRANEFANIPYARVCNSSRASNKRSRRAALAERDNNVKSIVEFGDCATRGRKLISDAPLFLRCATDAQTSSVPLRAFRYQKNAKNVSCSVRLRGLPLYTLFEVSFFSDRFCHD